MLLAKHLYSFWKSKRACGGVSVRDRQVIRSMSLKDFLPSTVEKG